MYRAWLALALLFAGSAKGQAPSYSSANIVNSANYLPGPFAPNSLLTVYGVALARSKQTATVQNNVLPTNLDSTWVYIDAQPVPLLYISDTQVNFVLPATVGPDAPVLRVVREGQFGPSVPLSLVPAAPALFTTAGYVLASRGDYSAISPDSPAHAGDTVVLWATGLGKTQLNPRYPELPNFISQLADLSTLQVTLAGSPVDPARIQYAGLTPFSAALFQINLVLPASLPTDPEVRVTVSGQTSPAGARLAVR
jgi:uncharacterized protein (TIGR03437 family)